MKRLNIYNLLLSVIILVSATLAHAEIAVIVNVSNPVYSLTSNEVLRIFMGKTNKFPGGSKATPVNQPLSSPITKKFNKEVCGKNHNSYKSYWSKLIFTGKGTPPIDGGDNESIKKLVTSNPDLIAYIDASALDDTVKVVFTIP